MNPLKIVKSFIPVLAALVLSVTACADANANVDADAREALAKKLPNIEAEQIEASPVKDIYSVDLGERYAYATADGKYVFVGELIDLETGVNYSQVSMGKKRVDTLAAIPQENYIVFPAKNKQHTVTVFTDIDCGYCRKLHEQIAQYNALGIEVRYLLRPRSGEQSLSWQKADAVSCSNDPQKNLTRAKQGIDITMKSCEDSPVRFNVITAQKLGLNGTPAVLSEGGVYMGGYLAPAALLEKLDAGKAGT